MAKKKIKVIKKESEDTNNTKVTRVTSEEVQNKQLRNIVIVMCVVILAAFLTYYLVQKASHPEYKGLQFDKIKQGNQSIYNVKVPITDPYTGETSEYYNMILTNNPIELVKKTNFTSDNIKLLRDVTISFGRPIETCAYWIVPSHKFVNFLKDVGGINVKIASTNDVYAKETNVSYATCDNAGNQTVIIVQNASLGGSTWIRETVKDCYVIDVNQCKTEEGFERFMLEIAVKSQGK